MPGDRTRTVAVRLTPAEHEEWLAAATAAGRGRLGSWVRDEVAGLLAGGASRRKVAVALGVDLRAAEASWLRLLGQLVRVGNLLNQADRLAHVHGVDPGTAAGIKSALGEVREVLRAIYELAAGTSSGLTAPAPAPVLAVTDAGGGGEWGQV